MGYEKNDIFRDFAKKNVLLTQEVSEILGVSRQQINNLVKQGKLTPVKETSKASLFLRADVDEYQAKKRNGNVITKEEIIGNNYTEDVLAHFKSIEERHIEIHTIHFYFNKEEAIFDGYYCIDEVYKKDAPLRLDAPTCVMIMNSGEKLYYKGINCGYSGTGPTASYKILLSIGVSSEDAEMVRVSQKISYYKDEEGWHVADRTDAIVNKDYPNTDCTICKYNDSLVLIQKNEDNYKKETNLKAFMKKYSFFIPRPIGYSAMSRKHAIESGHYLTSYDYEGVHQLVVKDASGNELWLEGNNEFIPVKKLQTLESILKKAGFDIPKEEQSLPDAIREWLETKLMALD